MTIEHVLICISFILFLSFLCWLFLKMDEAVNG